MEKLLNGFLYISIINIKIIFRFSLEVLHLTLNGGGCKAYSMVVCLVHVKANISKSYLSSKYYLLSFVILNIMLSHELK